MHNFESPGEIGQIVTQSPNGKQALLLTPDLEYSKVNSFIMGKNSAYAYRKLRFAFDAKIFDPKTEIVFVVSVDSAGKRVQWAANEFKIEQIPGENWQNIEGLIDLGPIQPDFRVDYVFWNRDLDSILLDNLWVSFR